MAEPGMVYIERWFESISRYLNVGGICMLTLENIDMNVDYDSLCFLESHLMHEVKRRGIDNFVEVYSNSIEEFRRDWSKINFCFLLSLLEYLSTDFKYDLSVKLDKFILDARDFIFVEFDGDLEDANERFKSSLPSFLKRGFVFSDIEEAV